MKNTFVFFKNVGTLTGSVTLGLEINETISSVVVGDATPVSNPPIIFSIVSRVNNTLNFTFNSGAEGTAYGVPLTVTTNFRVFVVTIACSVVNSNFSPYLNEDPDSFQDLVGDIEAGKTALSTTVFQFPSSFDPSGGYVVWDLLDSEGIIYSSGNAFSYQITSTGVNNIVVAKSLVNVPASIPASIDTPYQLRYTLSVNDQVNYQYENIRVFGFPTIPVGAQDSIEMQGDRATMSLVTEQLYQNYVLEIYQDNTLLVSSEVSCPEKIANGYFIAASFSTSCLNCTLEPYTIVWKYWNLPSQTFRENCSLWIVNSSMMQAIEDVKSKINKARQTLFGTADSQFPSNEVMKWLRRGADNFNGSYGVLTSFTFTNAKGAIREYWLMYAELLALDAQYLLETEKAFNFSGSNITLDVDRTSNIDAAASKIQSRLDNEFKMFKQNLIIKGNTFGDGSVDPQKLQRGAMGAVGILITPASLYGGFLPQYPR